MYVYTYKYIYIYTYSVYKHLVKTVYQHTYLAGHHTVLIDHALGLHFLGPTHVATSGP